MALPELLFATSNPGKQREIRGLLEGLPLTLLFLEDVGSPPEVPETGTTFEENARLKAEGYAPHLPGGMVAAEDSGIAVPALGGEPGVYSARYGGLGTDRERNDLLLQRMRGLKGADRSAYYEAVVVLLLPGGGERVFRGRVHGFIAEEPLGTNGFGYDPLFFHPPSGTTFGRTDQAQKDRYSHRGEAVRALRAFLEKGLRL
ncbi:MAG: RdgB/HAM1 family non-canonical purine NTP pyrophosphatase [Acidobacteriota bacterium]